MRHRAAQRWLRILCWLGLHDMRAEGGAGAADFIESARAFCCSRCGATEEL